MDIKIYLSKQGFDTKPEKSAGIIKTINSYELVNIDIENLYKKLTNGHFIHHECGYSASNNGGKCYTFKKQLLKQTQIACIDFDYKLKETKPTGKVITKQYNENEMPDWSNELLSNLIFKLPNGNEIDISPTFWMESFSAHNETEKKKVGNSVHLFYVFEDPICNINDYEKTVIVIIYIIYNALKQKGYEIPLEKNKCPFDPVSYDMFQGLWGSFNKKHGYSGKTYFWDEFKNAYKKEYKDFIFQVKNDENINATEEEIQRTIDAYSTVNSIDDIDISKSQYIKYKNYFGHEEGFHIMSVLKHEYARIEGREVVNNKQSLCYQICKKLLLGHCNDFFDSNEYNFYHEYKRCKIYNKRGSDEAAYMSHVIKLIGDTGALPLIEYKEKNEIINNKTIILDKTEYINDKQNEILNLMCKDKINFLIAAPGLGKTVFAKSLKGKTLVIELFNSIIKSEEKFSSNDFKKFYGDKYIDSQSIGRLNVCSANKFISWYKSKDLYDYNEFYDFKTFDNVILDESHLLCLSNYRYDIMGETVQYIKKLKSDYPDTNVILMTGTPFGETSIFNDLNIITIKAEPRYDKTFKMIQTSSIEGYMTQLIKDSLYNGLRIFIPIDNENWFNTFIESLVDEQIITKDKTYYFNQPKTNEEIEQNILNTKLVGDIKILGTSSYMSVGIDLEDWKTEFITIIPSGVSSSGNFSGIEVEQFANRHRKQNLKVYYVISKNENYNKKPIFSTSCRPLLNIKNDLLKKIYRTNPIIIKIPQYLLVNENDRLEVNEDMYNIFVYYKDLKSIISHPMIIYEYMENIGWKCEWLIIDNTHRDIHTKEHREKEKSIGVDEFMILINEWCSCNYPMIKVDENISKEFHITTNKSKYSLFDVESIYVSFSNYYAKNILFNLFLNIREYLTGAGTYQLIKDSYRDNKINISFISKHLLAIKLINKYKREGIWEEIYNKLSNFFNEYFENEHYIYKDNKSDFKNKLDNVVQGIWDSLSERVDDSTLQLVLESNYNNITDYLIDDFKEGINLIQTMYLNIKKETISINNKKTKIIVYQWDEKKLYKYEIRNDIKIK